MSDSEYTLCALHDRADDTTTVRILRVPHRHESYAENGLGLAIYLESVTSGGSKLAPLLESTSLYIPLYRPARLAQRGSFIEHFDSRSSTTKHQTASANASNLTKICSSLPTHTKPGNLDGHQAFGISRAHGSQEGITTP
jgi:hypothetical protein